MYRDAKIFVINFPGGSDGEEPACSKGDPSSIPGLGRSSEEGNGYPLQHSCLENSMDRGVWRATVHGVTETDTAERLTVSLLCPTLLNSFIRSDRFFAWNL